MTTKLDAEIDVLCAGVTEAEIEMRAKTLPSAENPEYLIHPLGPASNDLIRLYCVASGIREERERLELRDKHLAKSCLMEEISAEMFAKSARAAASEQAAWDKVEAQIKDEFPQLWEKMVAAEIFVGWQVCWYEDRPKPALTISETESGLIVFEGGSISALDDLFLSMVKDPSALLR